MNNREELTLDNMVAHAPETINALRPSVSNFKMLKGEKPKSIFDGLGQKIQDQKQQKQIEDQDNIALGLEAQKLNYGANIPSIPSKGKQPPAKMVDWGTVNSLGINNSWGKPDSLMDNR